MIIVDLYCSECKSIIKKRQKQKFRRFFDIFYLFVPKKNTKYDIFIT